jgi:hypothetical protein
MKSQNKILNVQPNGQVSLGKAFAGEMLQMELLPDGRILLTPVTVRPKHHEMFFTAEAKNQLEEFKEWQKKNPPSEDTVTAEELLTDLLKGKK